jgi:broad specificity phosphatase PhoE
MQVVYLLRHGETDYNRDGRVQGHTESDLSDLGREQARRLGERINDVNFLRAFTSPLRRAEQTCAIAMNGSVDYEARDGLREINLGEWEGRKASELRSDYPAEVKLWFRQPSALQIPGGETVEQFRTRVTDEMNRIRTEHPDGTLAVFAHGGVICTYLTSLLEMKLDDIWRFKIRNASVTRVIFPQNRPRIDLLGDIHHLDGALREIPDGSFRMFP